MENLHHVDNVFEQFIATSPESEIFTTSREAYNMSAEWPKMMEQPLSDSISPTAVSSNTPGLIHVTFPPAPNRTTSITSNKTLATPSSPFEGQFKLPPEPVLPKESSPPVSPLVKPDFPKMQPTPQAIPAMMSGVDDLTTQPLYPEITYITDSNGNLMAVEDYVWNRFLKGNVYSQARLDMGKPQGIMNDAQALEFSKIISSGLFENNTETSYLPDAVKPSSYPNIVGGNLFSHISDVKVQTFFRHILLMIVSGGQKRYTYQWFCDSPALERKMSMTVARLAQGDDDKFVLWSSKIIHEKPLECKAPYLDAPASSTPEKSCTVCSFCKRILVNRRSVAPQAVTMIEKLVLDNWTEETTPLVDITSGVPVFGLRGKQGQQWEENKGINFAWLTPAQFYSMKSRGLIDMDGELVNHGCCALCYREMAHAFFPQWLMEKH